MYFPVGMMMFPRPQFHPWKICQVGHDDVVRRPGAFLWEILLKSCFAYWILSGVITPHTKLRVERTSRWLTLSRGSTLSKKRKKHVERRHCWSFRNDTETRIHVGFHGNTHPKTEKTAPSPPKKPTKVSTFSVFSPNLGVNLEPLQVKSAMFSYDGLRIITASMDGTARVCTSIWGRRWEEMSLTRDADEMIPFHAIWDLCWYYFPWSLTWNLNISHWNLGDSHCLNPSFWGSTAVKLWGCISYGSFFFRGLLGFMMLPISTTFWGQFLGGFHEFLSFLMKLMKLSQMKLHWRLSVFT